MKEPQKQKLDGSGGTPVKPKMKLVKGTKFISILFIAVSILISAGIMQAANVYYDLDTNTIMVNDAQQISQTLTLDGTLRIRETGATPTKYTTFQGGDQDIDLTYTLPPSIGSGGYLSTNASGILTWAATAAGTAHPLLSATHSDTTAGSVVPGDLIIGKDLATDAWGQLARGAAGTVLQPSGAELAWSPFLSLVGGQTADITTAAGTAPTALVFQPGANSTVSGTGASLTVKGGNETGTTSTGGNVAIQGGAGTSTNGVVQIGAANTSAITLGATGITATNTGYLTSTQTLTASNGLTLTTGALNLTATSGALALSGLSASSISTGANALVLASGGTSSWTNTSGDLTIGTATSGILTFNTGGANEIIFNPNTGGAGIVRITAGDSLYVGDVPIAATNDATLVGQVNIFGFDYPAQCSTSCDVSDYAVVSRDIVTFPNFPAVATGKVRQYKLVVRYADDLTVNGNSTWQIYNTTDSTVDSSFTIAGLAADGNVEKGKVFVSADLALPAHELTADDDWVVRVNVPLAGDVIRVYSLELAAYDVVD